MKKVLKCGKNVLVLVLFLMLFGISNVFAEELQYSIKIDPNGGIKGSEYQDVIVLGAEETFPVSGDNENFLKAPEGKGFAGIEMIDKNGEVIGNATGVLLWGDEEHEGMTLKFHWGDLVSDINLSMENPEEGSETTTPTNEYGDYETDNQTNKPNVTVEPEYGLEIEYLEWVDVDSYVEEFEYYGEPYIGKFESGKKYYALVDLYCNSHDYALSDSLNIKVNGKKANVYKVVGYSTGASITLEVALEGTTYEVVKGAEQKVVSGEEAEFKIDADYSLFEEGGEVYVDDDTKPLEQNKDYTSKEGSTVITLTKDYIATLSEGEHTLKVLFNDGNTADTTFTVTNNKVNDDTNTKTTEEKDEQPPRTSVDNNTVLIFYTSIMSLITLVIFGKKYI